MYAPTFARGRAAALLLLALALAGCGDSGSSSSGSASGNAAGDAGATADDGRSRDSFGQLVTPQTWPPMPEGVVPKIDMTRALATNYYLVVDGSGSMMEVDCSGGQLKMDVASQAVARFIDKIPAKANIGLAVFDASGLSERVPLGANNRPKLRAALRDIQADQSTPLRSAIELAYDKLKAQGVSQSGYGEYHLVVVTDGQPEPRDEDPRGIVEAMLQESPVLVHTIGFCLGNDHALNQPGRTIYAAADSPQELQQGLAEVLAEAPSFDATSFQE